MHTFAGRSVRAAVLAACTVFLAPAVAWGQISLVGPTADTIPGFPIVRGTDSAFDPFSRVYLQVSAQGPVTARFVSDAGVPLGGLIQVTTGTVAFGQYPRVAYNRWAFAGAGGFLVTWHQNDGPLVGSPASPSNLVHGRLVSYAGGGSPVLSPDVVLGGNTALYGSWWEAAPAVATSTGGQFLVTWQTYITGEVQGVRVGIDGLPIGAPFLISDSYARDPSVAWNPIANEFGVAYSGADVGGATVTFARVDLAGTILRRTVIFRAAGTFITDIAYNPVTATFVVAYAAPSARTTEVNAAGDVVAHGLTYTPVGSYDGLALAFNPISGSHLLVGHYTAEVGGLELDGHGAKFGVEQAVTAGAATRGSFYPRVTANAAIKQWQISYSRDLAVAASQIIATTATLAPPPVDSDGDGVYDLIDLCPLAFAQTLSGCPAPGAQLGDMSGDGKADIVFVHTGTGMLYSWWLSNGQLIGQSAFAPGFAASADWLIVSKDDFTGDGRVDLLWQNQVTGEISLWPMAGVSLINNTPVTVPVSPGPWRIVATPDLNLDGHPDVLWQKYSTGDLYVWLVQWTTSGQLVFLGGGVLFDGSNFPIGGPGTDWRVVTTGDLNSDGKADLLWQHQLNGDVAAWYLGGLFGMQVTNPNVSIATGTGPWRVRMLNDMDSDGKLDIVWQSATVANALYVWYLNGAAGLKGEGVLGPVVALPPQWRVSGGK